MTDPTAFTPFTTRRSVVHSTHGIVSCTQPLAAQAGLRILQSGGNAADAAIATAAALGVTEPTSTGIGGDLFCLFFTPATASTPASIRALNASGRSPAALTLAAARAALPDTPRIPRGHGHCVTVPGAAAGWCDVVGKLGRLPLADVLAPAIALAEDGFPLSELAARFWRESAQHLKSGGCAELRRRPRAGEVVRLRELAGVMRRVAAEGRRGFYEGAVARAIVDAVAECGGVMGLEDLARMGREGAEEVVPCSVRFAGKRVWECPPNGQGVVALMALGLLQIWEEDGKVRLGEGDAHNSPAYLHAVIEALRIAFADAHWWVADGTPPEGLLDREYLRERAALFDPAKVNPDIHHGTPAFASTDTVYLSVTDRWGNGCSLIQSTFAGFGSGIVPKGCGFPLQNRGCGFVLSPPDHPNVLAPGKRPYHTIIPGLLTNEEGTKLQAVFGVMGGYMQPQGHVQVLLNLLKCGLDPQRSLDAPRISIGANYDPSVKGVCVEEGMEESTVEGLKKLGHDVKVIGGYGREMFGRGQIIWVTEREDGEGWVYSAGSDMRGDGHAVGY